MAAVVAAAAAAAVAAMRLPPPSSQLLARSPHPPHPIATAQGGSLFRVISKQMTNPHSRVYSDNDALIWMLQVAMALEHLHAHTPVVVHRDIKTQNIMLKKEQGGIMVAKLLDFSLSTVRIPPPSTYPRPPLECPPHLHLRGVWLQL
jgi:serine/threonine protein kinase